MLLISCNAGQQTPGPSPNHDAGMMQKVKDLMAKMTIEEKVGQMTQVTIDMVMQDQGNQNIDEAKLRTAVLDKKVGSILNVKWYGYDLAKWHEIISRIQDVAVGETPHKIPILYGIDAIHGANYILGGTLFPHNIGMAATRNDELVKAAAKITAAETRASGIRWNFDPVLDVGRQPLWPRFEETFGEDTYLTGQMGSTVIQAYEEDGLEEITAVASCMKHYLGYSVPLSGKDRTPAYIPETQLREIFLPPFEKAVKAGASTIMINSGEVNGVPVHASHFLLTDVLRGELGFEGLAVSDWEDVIRLHTRHKIAATPKEAVMLAVNAGIDMSMVPLDYSFYDLLLELVKEGKVSEKRIDEAVARILLLKFRLGLFDNPYPEEAAKSLFGRPEYSRTALNAALESVTLLKNEGAILPLTGNQKILVAGPGANNKASLHGSWSFSWQGQDESLYPADTKTIVQALTERLGAQNVVCRAVPDYRAAVNFDPALLKRDATSADLIVLCLGEEAYAESPGIISDLNLDEHQTDLAKAAIQTGKPVILVLTEGRPRIISPIEPGIKAILLAYRPASRGADAIADLLTGKANPSGVLPFSYPRQTGDLLTYDHKFTETVREPGAGEFDNGGYDPQWPFGFGLSYTEFRFSGLKLDKSVLKAGQTLEVSVTVSNTGSLPGKAAVDLYTHDLFASVTPSERKLRKYAKVELAPGESKTINFTLSPEDLSFINEKQQRIVEPGEFEVLIGDRKAGFTYE